MKLYITLIYCHYYYKFESILDIFMQDIQTSIIKNLLCFKNRENSQLKIKNFLD